MQPRSQPSYASQRGRKTVEVRRAQPAMGTLFEVLLVGENVEHLDAVAIAALQEVHRVERLISKFDPRSEIYRINRHAYNEPLLVDAEVANLLAKCLDMWEMGRGYFDIAAAAGIEYASTQIQFDRQSRRVKLGSPQVQLDLGGVGKGYAIDCAAQLLVEYGVTNALLQGGASSVLAMGRPAKARQWKVDLADPWTDPPRALTLVDIGNRALSYSAARHPGQATSDIINPRSGAPINYDGAVVCTGSTATICEMASTAMLAMGRSIARDWFRTSAEKFLRDEPLVDAAWFYRRGKTTHMEWFGDDL